MFQVRRFQIRFGKNEDYYEAMKMLARAKVPTVEAGTFPSFKPQGAPRTAAPPNLVAPDDSASQLGVEINPPRGYVGNTAMSAVSGPQQVPAAPPVMAPPQMSLGPTNRTEHHHSVQTPAVGSVQPSNQANLRSLPPKSNISLSTAATLVPGKQDPRSYTFQSRVHDVEGSFTRSEHISQAVQHTGNFGATQLPRIPMLRQEVGYELPPSRQELPARSIEQENGGLQLRSRTTRNTLARAQQDKDIEQPSELDDPPISKPSGKGKGKRAAPTTKKKAAAAKKPRTTAPAKKKQGKATQKESVVPTVEELLQQPGYSLLPYDPSMTARTMPRSQKINQQAEFGQTKVQSTEIAESENELGIQDIVSPELGQALPIRMTRSASRALSHVTPEVLNRQLKDTGKSKAAAPPCTPADQIIGNPPTPASPPAHAYTPAFKAMEPLSGRNPSFRLPTIPSPAVPGDPLLHIAQQLLAADENFDSSNDKNRLQTWNDLPTPTKTTAMNHYLCELLMQDSFVDLAKNISLHWEGAMLEGRIMRTSMVAAEEGGDETEEEEEL